jgi:hypothetical protein
MPSVTLAHQLLQMFGVSGYGLHYVKRFANDGKKARWNRDLWDRVSWFPSLSAAVGTCIKHIG